MRIGSFIVIVLSLIATAFSVAVTAVGWERILFYTGWMSSSFVYPASILLYILLFGLAMMRCRTITRASGAPSSPSSSGSSSRPSTSTTAARSSP